MTDPAARGVLLFPEAVPVDLHVTVGPDGLTIDATGLHPIDYDTAARLVTDLTLALHRRLAEADTEGA